MNLRLIEANNLFDFNKINILASNLQIEYIDSTTNITKIFIKQNINYSEFTRSFKTKIILQQEHDNVQFSF